MSIRAHSEAVAGGVHDFMVVHHLMVCGSNRDVGRALADAARQSGAALGRVPDQTRNCARRRWFQRNWPQHYARMEGVAAAYGRDVDDDEFDFSRLPPELLPDSSAVHCSAMWLSSRADTDGHTTVGRNLDFSTGTVSELLGASRQPGDKPVGSRPYVIETYPDDSAASIVVALGDFTGCVEGLNEHGLTVALLSDDESMSDTSTTLRPTLTPQAGLYELHVLRYLLDTCATAQAAREALYEAKQYDEYAVAHYLIADNDGAFVWERNTHNAEYAVDADGDGLCVTNHLLHRRARPSDIPDDIDGNPAANSSYARARSLYASFARAPLSADALWDALEAVRAQGGIDDPDLHEPPVRTLWHSQYDIEARSVTFEFYLSDTADGSPRRSAPQCFRLERPA